MSQASFLESVVTWDEKLCQQNVNEAVPKLINLLQEASVLQEEIGILKIISVSFLPWIQVDDAEQLVFVDITDKSCLMLDKILDEIKTLPKQLPTQDDIQALLQVLIDLLDCYTLCTKHVQLAGSSQELSHIQSLPSGAIHLLKGTYAHCKDSTDIYGEVLASVTEPLSVLFKKAHALQLAFLGLLETIVVSSGVSQQDVEQLCNVCLGLFEICQIVASLDVKLVFGLWKAISRLSGRHKSQLHNELDVDAMVTYLCGEINKGYAYLLQLAPPSDDNQELSLSQGNSAAFQKSLKVLGYQLRVTISLLDNFIDCVSECVKSACNMVIAIFRSLPPSIQPVNISMMCVDEIKRHLVNGIEPLINLLIQNRAFVTYISSNKAVQSEDRLAWLELLLKIVDCLPKQTDGVFGTWMSFNCDNNDVTCSLLDLVFSAVSQCYVELCLPVSVRTTKDIVLYEYVCTHVCGLVGSMPAKYFHVLETCLVKQLFCVNVFVSMLAEDVWCFMARFGSAELCFQQIRTLIELYKVAAYPHCLQKLLKRLVKFLAPDHQIQLLKSYPAQTNQRLWCEILVSALSSSSITTDNWTLLFKQTTSDINRFTNSRNKTYADLLDLIQSLTFLKELLHYHGNSSDDHQYSPVKNMLIMVLELWVDEWSRETIFSKCLFTLIDTLILTKQFNNENYIKVFDQLLINIQTDCTTVKIAACRFLQACKKVKFSPDANQPLLLKKIPKLYSTLLQDNNVLVHHVALESFTQFAENTPYETLVPECLADSPVLEQKVVAFLSKTAEIHPGFDELSYLKKQQEVLNNFKAEVNVGTSHQIESRRNNGTSKELTGDPSCGDMLDDIEEPALKRKRCQDDAGRMDNIESLVCSLEQNVCDLETVIAGTTLPSQEYKNRLKTLSSKLTQLVNKIGT